MLKKLLITLCLGAFIIAAMGAGCKKEEKKENGNGGTEENGGDDGE